MTTHRGFTKLGMYAAAGVVACVGAPAMAQMGGYDGGGQQADPHADLPSEITLTGVVRDFRERTAEGGHPDFERQPSSGFGHYMYIVQDQLDGRGVPVFRSTGKKVTGNWRDAQGRNIMAPREYIASMDGDVSGSTSSTQTGAATTADNFAMWFSDVAGVNTSSPLSLTLVRQDGSNVYTFDDKTDPFYMDRGGFFPINGEMYGNSAGESKNFHFTYHLDTEFVYERDAGLVFTFIGDDDVWVFIDGKLVIDIGGVHSAVSQTIDLDRLEWLEDGETYSLDFFFCERHRTQSNFRIETTLQLRNVELPPTSALYD